MKRWLAVSNRVFSCAAAIAAAWVPVERAAAQATSRASVDGGGFQGDFDSGPAVVSADGRFVAFASTASNLSGADMNFASDVFVHDRATGQIELISVDSAGVQANFDSVSPAISADGRFVAFASLASNLDPNDMNGTWDVFLRDRTAGVTTMVSVDSAGVQGNLDATNPAISAGGRFVAFQSYSSNLVADDTNGLQDIFVHDTQTGSTTRASVDSSGIEGDGESITPSISDNGLLVAFASGSTNLVPLGSDGNGAFDVFVHDFGTFQTVIASVADAGFAGNSDSLNPTITPDGGAVSFTSFATQLVAGDTNGAGDIFVRDLFGGTTERVSVATGGAQGNGGSVAGAIAAGGRFVGFRSNASNLVAGDTNFAQDVFVHDRQTGTTTRASVNSAGAQADDASSSVSISGDGLVVAFTSAATNLVLGDTNFASDVFVRDREPCADGTVNAGAGPVADVLSVNGSFRVATIPARTLVQVSLAASPAGPSSGVDYAVWVWRGLAQKQGPLTVGPSTLGCTVNPTPFSLGSTPQPFKCVLGGLSPDFCAGSRVLGRSPASAPWSLGKPSGLRSGTVLTLQGVVEDLGAANAAGLSATNAVAVIVP